MEWDLKYYEKTEYYQKKKMQGKQSPLDFKPKKDFISNHYLKAFYTLIQNELSLVEMKCYHDFIFRLGSFGQFCDIMIELKIIYDLHLKK